MFKEIDKKLKKPTLAMRLICLIAVLALIVLNFQDIFHVKAYAPPTLRCNNNVKSVLAGIPADCEGTDVIFDGSLVIDMSQIRIWQPVPNPNPNNWVIPAPNIAGQQCVVPAENSYPLCDTTRRFKSLTLSNGATLTHTAITYGDMVEDTNKNGSLADESTGMARWKKVAIIVDGGDDPTKNVIKLESGGKINVDGKGYLGAYLARSGQENNYPPDPSGCDGTSIKKLIGSITPIQHVNIWGYPTYTHSFGFGPSGGIAYRGKDHSSGGGGSFGGLGQPGTDESPQTYGTIPYFVTLGPSDRVLEWGSGGGAGSHLGFAASGDGLDVSCFDGGAGGGKIDLKATTLDIQNAGTNYVITADGQSGWQVFSDKNDVSSGGGSGGVIRLDIQNIVSDPTKDAVSVMNGPNPGFAVPTAPYAGKIIDFDGNTLDISGGLFQNLRQVSARGGMRSQGNMLDPTVTGQVGGGSGGGGGYLVLSASAAPPPATKQERKIKVTVWWMENGVEKSVNYFTILKDLTP